MGTRPEIIKMAPVYHELVRRGAPVALLHTGQHKDLAEPMYDFFGIRPDFSLHLNRSADTLEHLSALLIEKIGQVIVSTMPRAVLVHGDTSSALMAAMAAFYHQIPVAHVEAGLRSHDAYDPFPEEKNRELIARIARWHFAPTQQAAENLRREGIAVDAIRVVGNTAVDAVLIGQQRIQDNADLPLETDALPIKHMRDHRVILVTAHRRENWDGPLLSVAKAVLAIVQEFPDVVVVWPVHANPAVKKTVHSVLGKLPAELAHRVFLIPPLSYPAMVDMLTKSWLVMTDSGGLQEEAASVHVPILVLRETTERPELVTVGAGRLVGTDREVIVNEVRALWNNTAQYEAMREALNPFGDGTAAKQIVDRLLARDAAST
nr:UDP-N-acetylglucosamine 2-epimerase (non-hydrolyzing) [Rhodoferax sp.]